MINAGLVIAMMSSLPLLIYGAIDPTANPIGAGLLAGVGSMLGPVIAAFGLIRLFRKGLEALSPANASNRCRAVTWLSLAARPHLGRHDGRR